MLSSVFNTICARMPCVYAFMRQTALPRAVRGPVDRFALRLFAAICFSLAIRFSFFTITHSPLPLPDSVLGDQGDSPRSPGVRIFGLLNFPFNLSPLPVHISYHLGRRYAQSQGWCFIFLLPCFRISTFGIRYSPAGGNGAFFSPQVTVSARLAWVALARERPSAFASVFSALRGSVAPAADPSLYVPEATATLRPGRRGRACPC